jgi:alkanesulfonate monooxygenase SsuD/methylene tetrahydromethanopterin reductase-like flavin-dependent oxidoreductase (luciferase family)
MQDMALGYLTHVAGGEPTSAYRRAVELAVAAEELGFGSFWLAQHHGGVFGGLLPSPLVLLAAIAERTTSIRLGTAVIAASLENPMRLAEDAAVVDALSGGRLELGIGAGADAAASARFGRDHATRHADCAAAVDELCGHLAGPWLVPGAAGLRRRLWWATGSGAGVDAAAARGMGVLSGRPTGAEADLAGYWTRAVGEPRVAAFRIVGPGESGTEALARWWRDPVRDWATELVVQNLPTDADLGTQLATLRTVSRAVRRAAPIGGASGLEVRSRSGR